MTWSAAFASSAVRRIASESVSTGFHTIFTGTSDAASSVCGDLSRLVGHLLQGLGAVESLAARQEPDLVLVERGGERGAGHSVSP